MLLRASTVPLLLLTAAYVRQAGAFLSGLESYEYHRNSAGVIYLGDCLDVLAAMEPESIDTIITDPPYGLKFMGKDWDHGVPGVVYWEAALRVAKPGALLLAFGGTRTHHRLWCAIEDAGWEIRDCLMYLYGVGFPKALDISKAIDKAAGAEREVIGRRNPFPPDHARPNKNLTQWNKRRKEASLRGAVCHFDSGNDYLDITAPATREAQLWNGWRSALKPAWEPIILAMKPLDGTYAQNALKHGVAGLNIDGSRIPIDGDPYKDGFRKGTYTFKNESKAAWNLNEDGDPYRKDPHPQGRYPANLLLDEDAAEMLDQQSGELPHSFRTSRTKGKRGCFNWEAKATEGHADTGGASRFFYCAKASRAERNRGLNGIPKKFSATMGSGIGKREHNPDEPRAYVQNNHPTVKPLKLMRYLCTLTATPTGGIVLDPFAGSGTTLIAAKQMGRQYVGIELKKEYCEITMRRLRQEVLNL